MAICSCAVGILINAKNIVTLVSVANITVINAMFKNKMNFIVDIILKAI